MTTSRATVLTPILLLAVLAFLAQPAAGQRRTSPRQPKTTTTKARETRGKNPLDAARAMRRARQSAPQALRVLEKDWRQGPRDAASTLRKAGYPAREIATAFAGHRQVSDREVPGLLVAAGLDLRAAISAAEARSFEDPVFGTVDLDCVGPNGFPVPCGIEGGDGSPAMGPLSWSPQGQATTGEIVTIESTNIPAVSVRLGGEELELIEATSNRLRARLPAQATTGDLVLVRESDGQAGLVEADYRVLPQTAGPPGVPDWRRWVDVALTATIKEVDGWMAGARIVEARCKVAGPNAIGQEGVLTSDYRFEGLIRKALEAAKAPSYVAEGWQRGFEESWEEWADHVTIPGLPWYPSLAAVPAAKAPPTPNVHTPLVTLPSSGLTAMTNPGTLKATIVSEIGGVAAEPVPLTGLDALDVYATLVSLSFDSYLAQTQVMNVLAHGPVPVPGGPVDGSCYTKGKGPFEAAPPFGTFIDATKAARQSRL